jgi:hypothetical protein
MEANRPFSEDEVYNANLFKAQKEAGDLRGKIKEIHRIASALQEAMDAAEDLEDIYEFATEKVHDLWVHSILD